MKNFEKEFKKLDKYILIVPFLLIIVMSILFFMFPNGTNEIIGKIKVFFGDSMSIFFLFFNLFVFILSFYLAFSKFGNIKLGAPNERPQFSFMAWATMMFCCGISGDTVYYCFTEWVSYVNNDYIKSLGNPYEIANTYSVFFWSNYWFYLVIAVAIGYMLHCKGRIRKRYSEVLRPILKNNSDNIVGTIVDVFVTFVVICCVTCSLCFGAPTISVCLSNLLNIENTKYLTVIFLILICIIYSISVSVGFKGIVFLSKVCVSVFFILILYVLFFGGETRYILESSFKELGLTLNSLITKFTDIDPLRKNTFVQDVCVFYDSYWITWAVTVPFFISIISKGMSIKQIILGGYAFAVPGTILGFLIIPNFAMAKQIKGVFDFINDFNATGNIYEVMTNTINLLPFKELIMIIIILSMIIFCSTSFDSISLTLAYFSYKNLEKGKEPHRIVRLFWAILLVLLPIFITLSGASYHNIENIAVIAGFPGGVILLLVIYSFFKEARKDLKK